MRYTAILKMQTEVLIDVEAENGGEAEEKIRDGNYTCDDFCEQVLDNLNEADADIDIEEADTPA